MRVIRRNHPQSAFCGDCPFRDQMTVAELAISFATITQASSAFFIFLSIEFSRLGDVPADRYISPGSTGHDSWLWGMLSGCPRAIRIRGQFDLFVRILLSFPFSTAHLHFRMNLPRIVIFPCLPIWIFPGAILPWRRSGLAMDVRRTGFPMCTSAASMDVLLIRLIRRRRWRRRILTPIMGHCISIQIVGILRIVLLMSG